MCLYTIYEKDLICPCENERFQFSFSEFEEELFSLLYFRVVCVGYEKGQMNIKLDLRENKWV